MSHAGCMTGDQTAVSVNATPCAFGVTLFDCGIHMCSHICNMGFT